MRTTLFCVLLFLGVVGQAQDRCVTSNYLSAQMLENSAVARSIGEAEAFLKKSSLLKQISSDAVFRIPVVVHVLYNTASQNISDAQIKSGIDALNRDFRRRNADTVNTPLRFLDLAADVQIEFALASADPQGRGTSGILRKQISRAGWMADDKMKKTSQGGDDGWDSKLYLNIWIVNLIGASGYASVPGCSAAIDGVVIHYAAFGTINTEAPFQLGRTAVHEVGHWLGLKHIWGDKQCGDDGVTDTPQQGFFTQGCPSGFRSSCSNGEMGDMYMNYMDYTNDACMNLFTEGQRSRMRSAFLSGGPRASLLQSKGLNAPWLQESPLMATGTTLYPNPTHDKLTLEVSSEMLGKKLSLYNRQGQLQKIEAITSSPQVLDVSNFKPGVYFLKGESYQQKFLKL